MEDRRSPHGLPVLLVAAVVAAGGVLALAGCGSDADDATTGPSSGAVLPGGGLSVAEAIATDAEPPLAVSGWVVRADGDARLCSSYEPDADDPCGAPSLALDGEVEAETGEQVSLLGAVENGTFVVSTTTR